MKKPKNIKLAGILFLASGIAVMGCKKHTLDEVLPVVKMVSVQSLGIDSVILTGSITSNSGNLIGYEGFCYGTDTMPPITERQVLLNSDSTNFTAHLHVNKDSTYYFRCFAANGFGYGVSAAIK